MDEPKQKLGTDESSIKPVISCESASSADGQTTTSGDRRRILSAAALAAAVAAVGLPLIRVKPVEAAELFCASDSFTGFDIGDPPDLDCSYSSLPSDCYVVDHSSGTHWGTGPHSGDTGGGCGCGCGDSGDDYYGS
jgi:hypothetical protein